LGIPAFPIKHGDKEWFYLDWHKNVQNIDENGLVEINPTYRNSDMVVSLDFDFTQREYTVTFVTFWDIFAEIGGLKAAILPLVHILVPFWILFFLISLSHIIKDASAEKAKLEFIDLLHVSVRQLKLIQMLKDTHFTPDLSKALSDITSNKVDEKNVE
jgi:hypothetical protein